MNLKASFIVFLFLSILYSASAADLQNYNASYDLILDKAIVDLTLSFDNFHSQVEWTVPQDASAIEVSEGLTFEIQEDQNSKNVIVNGKLFNTLHLKYITSSVIEKTKDRFFILDLSSVDAKNLSITVKLPEEANLKYTVDAPQPSIIPVSKDIKTDGQRIIIHWGTEDLDQAKSILVIYTLPQRTNPVILGIIVLGFVIVFSIGGFIYYFKNKKRKHNTTIPKKKKEKVEKPEKVAPEKTSPSDLTRNLFEEEKKIVEILLESKGNELWQKELAHKSGLSKVKLSRKIRNLEQKGLIEKIPYGNTNKIRVKKE